MVAEKYPLLFGKFPNYFDLLGISGTASTKDILRAYKRVALREHPDKAGNTARQNELFAAINNAKAVLTDDSRRTHYDRELRLRGAQTTSGAQPTNFAQQQSAGVPVARSRASETTSSNGTGFEFKFNSRPFTSGSGFGPERTASQGDRDGSTASSKQAHNSEKSHSTPSSKPQVFDSGCPLCGSRFCPGSCYSIHANRQEIPCSQPDGQHEFRQANPGERTRPHPAPSRTQSRGRKRPSTKSQIPRVGYSDYEDPNRRWPFMNFKPPLTAYEPRKHGAGFWYLMRWKHFSLSEEHQKTADLAMEVCLAAEKVDRNLETLVDLCSSDRLRSLGESYQRLTASLHLVREVMYFAAAGYGYYSWLIDQSLCEQVNVAVSRLIEVREPLLVLLGNLNSNNALMGSLADLLDRPRLKLNPEAVIRGACTIVAVWDHIVILPDNITQGAQDIFFSRSGRFENGFERRGDTSGYSQKQIIFKMRVQIHQQQPWTQEDEELIRRNWEVGQRTREAQRDVQDQMWRQVPTASFHWSSTTSDSNGAGGGGSGSTNWDGMDTEMTG